MKKLNNNTSILLVGGFGHAVWVFDEWLRDDAPATLIGAVQSLKEESLDGFLSHPWAQKHTVPIYEDLSKALKELQPDIVVVSTRPDLNPSLISQCLRAGCHVISEKPLAVDHASLQQLFDVVKETQKYVLPMLGMHEVPAFVEAQEMVKNGSIGKPLLINARKSYQWGQRAEWFKDRSTYGGIWPWVGIHSFNHAAHILGKHVTRVIAAQEQNRAHPKFADACSDVLTGLFLLEDDLQMTVSLDLLRPDGQVNWGDDWLRIVGTEGSLEAHPDKSQIRLIQKGKEEKFLQVTTKAPPFYTAFLEVLQGQGDYKHLTSMGFQLTDSALHANQCSQESIHNLELQPQQWILN
jgi:predicted dehydrogenase